MAEILPIRRKTLSNQSINTTRIMFMKFYANRNFALPIGGMRVVRVQASALDVGSDVTIQRYSFFEILEIIFTFMQRQSHVYIPYTLYTG